MTAAGDAGEANGHPAAGAAAEASRAGRAADSPGDAWQAGWLCAARHCVSPNVGPRPPGTTVDLALIHSISLPPGRYGGDAIERLFTNRLDWEAHPYFERIRGLKVSSHFLLRRDGECVQFVSCDDRAWHAGESSWQGRPDCNDFSIGIELEGLEGDSFEAAQYGALIGLLQRIAERYGVAAVAGHEHVAPGRKRDPGAGFNWNLLAEALPTLGRPAVQSDAPA